MTGEFYALLSQHSILARTLDAGAPLDEAAFLQGVTQAGNGEGLLHNAFGARTLALFERMSRGRARQLPVGAADRRGAAHASRSHAAGELVLIGAPALTQRYAAGAAGRPASPPGRSAPKPPGPACMRCAASSTAQKHSP